MSTRSQNTVRKVYNVTKKGPYKREHRLTRIGMGIRREDTRHGGTSNVVLWTTAGSSDKPRYFAMTLAEARAFRAFLDRELETLAR